MALLSTVIGRGDTASKPGAGDVPVGSLYFDTTLGKLQRSTGAAWEDCAETTSVTFSDAEGDPAAVALAAADGTSEYPARRDHAHADRAFCGVRAYKAAAQTISHNTWTAVQLDTERFDSDGFHSTVSNNTRFTVPAGKAGYYLIIGQVEWDGNVNGDRYAQIYLNNSIRIADVSSKASANAVSRVRLIVSTIYHLAEGDYVELRAYQDSGGDLNVLANGAFSPEFSMTLLGV